MKKYGVAALLVGLAAGVSVTLKPLLADFPALAPLIFLIVVAGIARYMEFAPSIFALCASTVLLGIFFFPADPRHSGLGITLAKTVAFSLLGVCMCSLLRSLDEARASRARLAAIVDTSNDAIISLDLNGIVTSWNAAAVQMFGYWPQEIIGCSVSRIIPPELREQEAKILQNLTGGSRLYHFEADRIRKDGSRIKVSLTISPLRDSHGNVEGVSGIIRDITERVDAAGIH